MDHTTHCPGGAWRKSGITLSWELLRDEDWGLGSGAVRSNSSSAMPLLCDLRQVVSLLWPRALPVTLTKIVDRADKALLSTFQNKKTGM